MKNNSLFITIEGGEGAGKSSLIAELQRYFVSLDREVIVTREPGGTHLGEEIRKWLLNPTSQTRIGDLSETLLFLAARAQHIEELIKPALKQGKIVLCDRFNDSTVAYQGGARKLGIFEVQNLCDIVCGDVKPNLTLFLDVDPQVGISRTKKIAKENAPIGGLDRIEAEKMAFHHSVREAFKMIAEKEPQRFRTIDAHQAQRKVLDDALNVLKKFLNN